MSRGNQAAVHKNGGPDVIRTHDLAFRKRLLYPAELRNHPEDCLASSGSGFNVEIVMMRSTAAAHEPQRGGGERSERGKTPF